ncbi:hypothetical protein Pelo_403 [Pelomyxa schiedti]|nr:hypothetical protein Pelo_403 [Pelomyxa schiedti]
MSYSLRARDQIATFLLAGHPRCGSLLAPAARVALMADGYLVARLLWSFVTETATNFVFGEVFGPVGLCHARPHAFSVSPALLGLTGAPRPHAQGAAAAAAEACARTWWVSPTRWVDRTFSFGGALSLNFAIKMYDCGGGGGGGCGGSGETTERVLWKAKAAAWRNGGPAAVNWRWFVGSAAEADGESGDGDAMVRDMCGGMVGVVIMSVTGDAAAQPDPGRVVVPISGECRAADYVVALLSFTKSNSNEMIAVVSRKNDDTETRFILFDVESSYNSKSLVIVSETRSTLSPSATLVSVLPLKRKGRGERCPSIPQIIEVEETTGHMRVLICGHQGIHSLHSVRDSQFCVCFRPGEFIYQIWDCSGAVSSMVLSVPYKRVLAPYNYCAATAESGFIFTVEEHQLKVIDASSGVVVLCLALPEILSLDGFIFTVEEHQLKVIDASSGVVVLCLALPEILSLDGVSTLP